MTGPVVILVPGLRGEVADHWQTHLAATLPNARTVPPLGRAEPSLHARVSQLQGIVAETPGPVVLVAHSAGCLVTVHWAAGYRGSPLVGALLATPPTLATELPPEYPTIGDLRATGWLPIPRQRLPFPSIVAASENDPLANPVRLRSLARAWGSRLLSLGAVGHLNPASGFGEWPGALPLVDELLAESRQPALSPA
jgi:predicted alpha/beta hydrolase family esterase